MKHLKSKNKEEILKKASGLKTLDLLFLSAKHDYLEGIKKALNSDNYATHRKASRRILRKAAYIATKYNSSNVINLLLEAFYNYDDYDPFEDVFTVTAAEYNSCEVLKELHKKWSFPIHFDKEKVLRFALSSGSVECASYVIEDGVSGDGSELTGNFVDFALWNNDLKNAKLLIDKGKEHNIADQTIENLVEEGKEEMLEFIKELGYGEKIQERREFIEYINRPL